MQQSALGPSASHQAMRMSPGARVEAEWAPGQRAAGQVAEVAADGRLTIRFDDGRMQVGVPPTAVRPLGGYGTVASSATPTVPAPSMHGAPAPSLHGAPASSMHGPPAQASSMHGAPGGTDSFAMATGITAPSTAATSISAAAPAADPSNDPIAAVRQRLAAGVMAGDADELQLALAEAQHMGIHGPEVRRARDTLMAIEANDFRRRADIVVEEAIEADDWWKLQAAMATVVSSGGDGTRLQEAMRTFKKRQEAVAELRRATTARDPHRLRTAVEVALKAHVREKDVRRARDELRTLEAQVASRAQLQQAMASKDINAIKAAVDAMQRAAGGGAQAGSSTASAAIAKLPQEDQTALEAAKAELRRHKLANIQQLHQAQDITGMSAALEDAGSFCLRDTDVSAATEELSRLRTAASLKQELHQSIQSGEKARLIASLRAADSSGLVAEEYLAAARKAVNDLEAKEQQAASRAAVARELHAVAQAEDIGRVAAALAAAEGVGLVGAESMPARERYRFLQVRQGAVQEMRSAAQAGDLYRLRAAIAAARGAHVGEVELQKAKEALRSLEVQAQVRRSIEAAVTSRNATELRRVIDEAKRHGLPSREIAQAEDILLSFGQINVMQHVRDAMAAGDPERLRAATRAATDAGASGPEFDAALARLRELEFLAWLRRQLQTAIASGDAARLHATIRQAETAGLASAELEPARREMQLANARTQARQELQLARVNGNPYNFLQALRAAEAAGLPEHELAAARSDHTCLQQGKPLPPQTIIDPGPKTDPQVHDGPPTQPQLHAPPTPTGPKRMVQFNTDISSGPPTDPQLSYPPWAKVSP